MSQTKKQDGTMKYDTLVKLVKVILCLTHGNAELKRSISKNKKLWTKTRSLLSISPINALRQVKDAVRIQGGVLSELSLIKVLIISG